MKEEKRPTADSTCQTYDDDDYDSGRFRYMTMVGERMGMLTSWWE